MCFNDTDLLTKQPFISLLESNLVRDISCVVPSQSPKNLCSRLIIRSLHNRSRLGITHAICPQIEDLPRLVCLRS